MKVVRGIRWHVYGRASADHAWQFAMAASSLADAFRFCLACDRRGDFWNETEIVPAGEHPDGRRR